ncbi:hypothetical protein [Symbioplanes lichenis]|uniref:hypothetical protein n=1 Tax=Symbioplanes lichenis TaxID=1629072 RepID=UPI002739E4E6|nr:hypothetical protein [Actinoplanes lichenis]
MTSDPGRAYRRVLRAYPPGPRREELLVTLLDAGRRRPSAREIVNLSRHGLRARLGYPRSRVIVLLSLLVALFGAIPGAAAGHRLGWEFAPELPTGAAADAIKATVFPGLPVWGGGDTDVIVTQSDGEGIEYGFATYWINHTGAATRDVTGYTAGVRDRLAAAGWQVRQDDELLTARRGELILGFQDRVFPGAPEYDSDGGASFTLRRAEPPGLTRFAWAGAGLGAVLTWLLVAFVCRRLDAVHLHGGFLTAVTGLAILCFLPSVDVTPVPDPPGLTPWWAGMTGPGITEAPRVFAEFLAGSLILAALVAGPGRDLGRRLVPLIDRITLDRILRRPRVVYSALVAVPVLLVVALTVPMPWSGAPLAFPACRPPAGPPPAAPESEVRDSRQVRVYVSPGSTADERNLITAAMRRSNAGLPGDLVWDPGDGRFVSAYCGNGTLMPDAVAGLPYFFGFELGVATDYPALFDEVHGLAGVVAVQRIPE